MTDRDRSRADRRHPAPRAQGRVDKIGGRKLKPSTLMMGHGYDPALSEGSLKPPIFLTSTFVFQNAAAGKRHFEGVTGKRPGGAEGLVYSRFNGPNQEILEDRLGIWEDAEDALAFSSGMSAIATLFLSMVKPGDTIVHSGPLYAATETLIARILGRFGVHWLDFPAGATREEIDAVLSQGRVGQRRPDLSRKPGQPDQRPGRCRGGRRQPRRDLQGREAADRDRQHLPRAALGASRSSRAPTSSSIRLTKYAGGHSDLVAGGVLGSKEHINTIRLMRNTIGTICDPNTAWMLLRSLETLELRMSRAGENAVKVCDFLRDHPKVEHVGYLGFLEDGSRQADIYNRHCTGAGSTFSLYLKGGEKEAFAFLDALKIAKLAVSLGGTETLASHPAA